MLIWCLRMLKRYVCFLDDGGKGADLFLYLHLDVYAYTVLGSTLILFYDGITSYAKRLNCFPRYLRSRSNWMMESINDPKYISNPSITNSITLPAIHTTYLSARVITSIARVSHSIARFAHDLVRMTDVGRNTKRKRKETSQQRSIYLVCYFLLIFSSLLLFLEMIDDCMIRSWRRTWECEYVWMLMNRKMFLRGDSVILGMSFLFRDGWGWWVVLRNAA
jgi:hypothetical protein